MKIMKKYYNCAPWGIMLLRIAVGAIFIAHGWGKIENMPGTVAFFGSLGFPAFLAYAESWIEFVGGIMMVLGIFSKVAGYFFVVFMAVVILKVKGVSTFMGGHGYELELLLLAASLAVAWAGPGMWALGPKLCWCCKRGSCKGATCPCHVMCGSMTCGGAGCGCASCKDSSCTCMMTSPGCCGCDCKNCGEAMDRNGMKCDNCDMCKDGCSNHEGMK